MSAAGDSRNDFSTEEDAGSTQLKLGRMAQTSCLPFSVEALMSETRPLAVTSKEKGNYDLKEDEAQRTDECTQNLISIKSEPLEQQEFPSWISSSIKMSTPPRKSFSNPVLLLVSGSVLNQGCFVFFKSGCSSTVSHPV